ncbi:methyltransferase type 11 [Rhizoctonia solani 123E]|uniref:Methyltransferase type 11 n=1 Tax=Rhizoctonia solani 123E TaxID=1423351 RepID=A0A074RNE9_9AGAM|nr:methyltransferase type 11 [Rhizoctonia solani 123E]
MGNFSSRVLARRKRSRQPVAPSKKLSPSLSVDGSDGFGTSGPPPPGPTHETSSDYDEFLRAYPRFAESVAIDELRARDFTRLSRNAVYLDYMGGGQYPESLVRSYAEILQSNVFGNTHSESMSSQLSEQYSREARTAVLSFFDADPEEYIVVWTANATAGLKLVGESFPFTSDSSLILPVDAHNSVQGIRAFAGRAGANVKYVPCLEEGGFNLEEASRILQALAESPGSSDQRPRSLMALTGLSNLTNRKVSLQGIISAAQARGVHTILDAAALAPTTRISLRSTSVDSMVVSFYKMFGFPTGVGALIAKKGFLDILERPWFAGGAVDLVQVPGVIATPAECISSRFEEGTINYLTLPAVTAGINILSGYMDLLPVRLSSLYHYLYSQLSMLQHQDTKTPVVQVLTGEPSPPSTAPPHGYVLSFLILDRKGEMVPLSHIEALAARKDHKELPAVSPTFKSTFKRPRGAARAPPNGTSTHSSPPLIQEALPNSTSVGRTIALRTGCACNPGGAAALLGIESYMQLLQPGATQRAFELVVGRELGVIRVSLGWVSDWSDIAAFIQFVKGVQEVVG